MSRERQALLDIVGHQYECRATISRFDEQASQGSRADDIEARERLVRQKDVRLMHDRACYRHPLFHSAAQESHWCIGSIENLHRAERAFCPLARIGRSVKTRGKLDILARGQRVIKETVVRYDSDSTTNVAAARHCYRTDARLAGAWPENSSKHPKQRRFPGAVGAEYRQRLARFHGYRNIVDSSTRSELSREILSR